MWASICAAALEIVDIHTGSRWWWEQDSNLRRLSQRIYSPSRLTAPESPRAADQSRADPIGSGAPRSTSKAAYFGPPTRIDDGNAIGRVHVALLADGSALAQDPREPHAVQQSECENDRNAPRLQLRCREVQSTQPPP